MDVVKNEKYGILYESMALSKEFQALTPTAKLFLVLCTMQYNRTNIYKGDKKGIFTFPKKRMEQYGYDSRNGRRYLKELLDNGFIEVVEKNFFKENIYEFSEKWKNNNIVVKT